MDNAYVIRIEETRTGRALTAEPGMDGPTNRILLARLGPKFRCEVLSPPSVLWITDGVLTWKYLQETHEYTRKRAEPWPQQAGPGPDLPGIAWKYVTKFRAVRDAIDHATITKQDIAPDRTCRTRTVLVELALGDREEPVKERLRLDPLSGFICTASIVRIRVAGGTPSEYTTNLRWTYEQTSGPVDERLFVFEPPKKARLVERFHRRSWSNSGPHE